MDDYANTFDPWQPKPDSFAETFHEASKLHFPFSSEADRGPIFAEQKQIASRSFREHEGVSAVLLSQPEEPSSLETVLLRRRSNRQLSVPIKLSDLSRLMIYSAGVTAVMPSEDESFGYSLRAWPSSGGLGSLEVYLSIANSREFEDGIYHFRPLHSDLVRVPGADQEKIRGDGYFHQDFIKTASVLVLIVAVFGRLTAKYGERGYRLALLDAGHLAQNFLLEATHLGLPCVPIGGFSDDTISDALKINGTDEAVIHSIALGGIL